MKKTLQVGLLCLIVLALAQPTAAQTAITVRLYPPNTDLFPLISTYLDVHSAEQGFVHGLQPEDVTVIEDGQALPVGELTEIKPGVQFVIAVTPGQTFDVRDAQGISRYEYLLESMRSAGWDEGEEGSDDFSLVIAGGPEIVHSAGSTELLDAMRTFEPPHGEITPDLEVLSRAIDIAADPTSQAGTERAVLFITPPLLSGLTAGLQSLAGQANQLGVRLFIWLVAPSDYFPLPGATQLRMLAEENGGSYFAFSGVEEVPEMESYLEPLRYIYNLTYESRAVTSGVHQLAVEVSTPDFQISTSPQNFSLVVAPPNPIFVSPPSQIERTYSTEEDIDPQALTASDLIPTEQPLKVRIEFPDGYERTLVRTVLYIDGTDASENTSPPFDEFTWDLSAYSESGRHVIQVEATDQLGLSGRSIEKTVQIDVPTPTQNIMTTISRQAYLIGALVGLLLLALLGLGLVLSGRVQPRQIGRPKSPRRKGPLLPVNILKRKGGLREPSSATATVSEDRTVPPAQAPAQRRPFWEHWFRRFTRAPREQAPQAFAFLTPLAEAEQPILPAPFQIVEDRVAIGSDPDQAAFTLDEPAVEPLHTHLVREGETIRVLDAGTTAGTWVNYERIPSEGVLLEHGDLLHVGRVGFRFALREPPHIRKPVVIPLDTPQ
jgi:hypothetical protein